MTAQSLAELLHARRVARGRWISHCPGHFDSSPSLYIREFPGGTILMNCDAACKLNEILKAIGLARRDLRPGPPASAEQAELIRASLIAHSNAQRRWQTLRRHAWDRVGTLEEKVDAWGTELARTPDNASLAKRLNNARAQLELWESFAQLVTGPVRLWAWQAWERQT